jgi:hypothetical protein
MTGSCCQAAGENGAVPDSDMGLFLCLPWVRERGSGHCENLLRSLGMKVLSWARGLWGMPSWEQAVVSLRQVLLECEGGVWFYHLLGAQGRSEWRLSWAQNGGTFACIFLLVTSLFFFLETGSCYGAQYGCKLTILLLPT